MTQPQESFSDRRHGDPSGASDARLDIFVGNLLRTGVLISAAVVLLGGAIYLPRHGLALPDYGKFHAGPASLRSVSGILGNVLMGSGRGVIQLGVLLLIATPVMRVVLLLVGFAWQRDRLYVAVSFIVLMALLYSLFGGWL